MACNMPTYFNNWYAKKLYVDSNYSVIGFINVYNVPLKLDVPFTLPVNLRGLNSGLQRIDSSDWLGLRALISNGTTPG